jgi:hypothetical protein
VRIAPDFERLRIALYCGQPDRVPLLELFHDLEVKEAFLGRPIRSSEDAYCLGSSNTVTNYVPLANFRAMVEADFVYGHYPLDQASGYETGGDQETLC